MPHRSWPASAAALLLGLLASQAAQAACYVVYASDRQVIYRAQTPPVDMSLPLHETLPRVAPGGSMVFSLDSNGCELEFNRLPVNVADARPALAGGAIATQRAPRAPRN